MKKLYPILLSCFLSISGQISGQEATPRSKTDSLLLLSAKDSLIFLDSSVLEMEIPELAAPSLEVLIKKGRTYSLRANEIMLELQESLDTTRFAEEIPEMEENISQIRERAKSPNSNFNFRYVNALFRILNITGKNNDDLDNLLQARLNRLHVLDSLLTGIKQDDFFRYKIRDTLLLPMYSGEIEKLKSNLHYLDSTIYRQELQAARYQSRLSSITIGVMELKRYVEVNKSLLEKKLLHKEINYIWESYSIPSPKSIAQITLDSVKLNYLFLLQQLRSNPTVAFFALLVLILSFWSVKFNLRKIEKNKEFGKIILGRMKYLAKRPFASVMVAVLPLVLFMFDTGSIAYSHFSCSCW